MRKNTPISWMSGEWIRQLQWKRQQQTCDSHTAHVLCSELEWKIQGQVNAAEIKEQAGENLSTLSTTCWLHFCPGCRIHIKEDTAKWQHCFRVAQWQQKIQNINRDVKEERAQLWITETTKTLSTWFSLCLEVVNVHDIQGLKTLLMSVFAWGNEWFAWKWQQTTLRMHAKLYHCYKLHTAW